MKEYVPTIIQAILGVISPLIVWRLKVSINENQRLSSLGKEHRDEIKELYTRTYSLLDKEIREVLNGERFTLAEAFSDTTAQIRLLAPDHIVTQYLNVAKLLQTWAPLYFKTLPTQFKRGEDTVTITQYPDPTAKFKKPAQEAYEELQCEVGKLLKLMRHELATHNGLLKARTRAADAQDVIRKSEGQQPRGQKALRESEARTNQDGGEHPALESTASRTDTTPRVTPPVS